jgi:hypothetical protein
MRKSLKNADAWLIIQQSAHLLILRHDIPESGRQAAQGNGFRSEILPGHKGTPEKGKKVSYQNERMDIQSYLLDR